MANCTSTQLACGDFTVGQSTGIDQITTTTSADLIGGASTTLTAGAGITYTAGIDLANITTGGATGIIGYTANGYGTSYGSYSLGYDKSIIIGKEGDVFMDLKNMKFKVYCDEKGWVEYDMEDFSTKNKTVELNGSKNISVAELITERSKRKVLIEKVAKKKEPILIEDSGIWMDGTLGGNYTINIGGYNQINGFVGGHNNIAIGNNVLTTGYYYPNANTNVTFGTTTNMIDAMGGNNNTAITINGNTEINGTLTVNGSLNASGNITVNGNKLSQIA